MNALHFCSKIRATMSDQSATICLGIELLVYHANWSLQSWFEKCLNIGKIWLWPWNLEGIQTYCEHYQYKLMEK
jgi:hypothetical protein